MDAKSKSAIMSTACLVLAAGRSTRMKSSLPKVLYPLCGREIINQVIDNVREGGIQNIGLVLGFAREKIAAGLDYSAEICVQKKAKGTAHAVWSAHTYWDKFRNILILYGDHPLVYPQTIRRILKAHTQRGADLTMLSTFLSEPGDFGRLIRDEKGRISQIKERKDLTREEIEIKETNPGVMCFKTETLKAFLPRIKMNPKKKEYYLTDIVALFYRAGRKIEEVKSHFPEEEGSGINTFFDFVKAEEVMRMRIIRKFISKGVKIFWPQSIYIEAGVSIGRGTKIFPFTIIESDVKIGQNCTVGPFSHIRRGTRLKDGAEIGNFAEIKNSRIDMFTKIKHFSYIGDAQIGKGVNIGAGTVTANFDGKRKNRTIIKDYAFIGSDTVMVAPVSVGRGAKTGAGSVITKNKNVKDGEVVAGVPAKILKKWKI